MEHGLSVKGDPALAATQHEHNVSVAQESRPSLISPDKHPGLEESLPLHPLSRSSSPFLGYRPLFAPTPAPPHLPFISLEYVSDDVTFPIIRTPARTLPATRITPPSIEDTNLGHVSAQYEALSPKVKVNADADVVSTCTLRLEQRYQQQKQQQQRHAAEPIDQAEQIEVSLLLDADQGYYLKQDPRPRTRLDLERRGCFDEDSDAESFMTASSLHFEESDTFSEDVNEEGEENEYPEVALPPRAMEEDARRLPRWSFRPQHEAIGSPAKQGGSGSLSPINDFKPCNCCSRFRDTTGQPATGTVIDAESAHQKHQVLEDCSDIAANETGTHADTVTDASDNSHKSWLLHPSLTEAAIRAAAPFFSQWLPKNNTDNTSADIAEMSIQGWAGPDTDYRQQQVRQQDPTQSVHLQDTCGGRKLVVDPSSPAQQRIESSSLPLPPPSPSPVWSYFPSRFLGSPYQSSIASWRDSFIAPSNASLLSTHIHLNHGYESDEEEFKGEQHQNHAAPGAGTRFSYPTAAAGTTTRTSSHGHGNSASAVKRLTGLLVSTGHATLGYLNDTVAPVTVQFAHKSASTTARFAHQSATSTLGFLSTQMHAVPKLFHEYRAIAGAHGHQEAQNEHEHEYGRDEAMLAQSHRSKSAPNLHSLQQQARSLAEPSPVLVTTVDPRERHCHRRSTDGVAMIPMGGSSITPTINSNNGNGSNVNNNNNSNNISTSPATPRSTRPRRARRYPLQKYSGPEHLDPEIRRQLEAEGLASLGLRDGTEDRSLRSYYDPRRYGLRKFILCHQIRTPRPCTTILFAILVVCIVCRFLVFAKHENNEEYTAFKA